MASGYYIEQSRVEVWHSWNHEFDILVIFSFYVIIFVYFKERE